jgi:hypothetical protein
MYVKKLKRKCSVRGCKNTDTFAISLSSEVGGQVIICKSCLEAGCKAVSDYKESPNKRKPAAPPALFIHNEPTTPAETTEPVEETQAEPTEPATPPADGEYVCPHCGQVCKSELGLLKHIQAKHKDKA